MRVPTSELLSGFSLRMNRNRVEFENNPTRRVPPVRPKRGREDSDTGPESANLGLGGECLRPLAKRGRTQKRMGQS